MSAFERAAEFSFLHEMLNEDNEGDKTELELSGLDPDELEFIKIRKCLTPLNVAYSLESTMAEKFDAVLKRMTASSRMKDFYDIYYWSKVFDFEGRVLQEAIFETLQHRGTSYERDSMEQIKVLVQIDRFIGPAYESLLREDEFLGMWSSNENVWK